MSDELVSENQRLRIYLNELLEQAHRNQHILRRQHAVDLEIIGAGSFRDLVSSIFHTIPASSELDVVTLVLVDPAYDIRRILADLQIPLREFPHLIFAQEEAEFGELRGRLERPLLDVYTEQRHGFLFPEPIPMPKSVAVVPLRRQGRLIGCLNLGSSDPARFSPDMATDFIEHRGSIVAICLENVLNHERLKHIGLTDPLTGVNNRRYVERRLLEEIGRTRRQGYPLSCMYIDIDHFKRINDRVGHQAGDEVLREVAARIKAELRLTDALGRFGGEEFVVLLIDADSNDAMSVAERIRQSVSEPALEIGSGEKLDVTVSVGVAMLNETQDVEPVETIARRFIARADRALYRAKKEGRNRVVAAD